MKLITEELEELFKDYSLYSQEDVEDPFLVTKLSDPCGSTTWYLTEYDPVEKIAFGYVTRLQEDELGYVSLEELESIERSIGLTIERDLCFVQEHGFESLFVKTIHNNCPHRCWHSDNYNAFQRCHRITQNGKLIQTQ